MTLDSVSMRYQFAQLATLCRKHPVAPKVVFVPTLQVGHNLGSALAQQGVSWVNAHFTTPLEWANRSAAPALEAAGRQPVSQDTEYFFMRQVLSRTDWGEGHPYATAYAATALAETFLQTIRSLRLASMSAEELAASTDGMSLERRNFIHIYRSYEQWLGAQALYDQADLYRRAMRRTPMRGLVVAVFDETPLPELAFRFVKGLSPSLVRIGRSEDVYGLPPPQESACKRFNLAPTVVAGEGTVGPGGDIYRRRVGDAPPADILLREAVGTGNEVRGALREALRAGARADEIELVYTAEDPYLPLIVDVLDGLHIPSRYAAGIPATLTRAGQSLLGFYRWMAEDCKPEPLISLLRSRLLFVDDPGAVAAAADVILAAGMRGGRSAWDNDGKNGQKSDRKRLEDRLSRWAEAVPDDAAEYKALAQKARKQTMNVLDDLYKTAPDAATFSLEDVVKAGQEFLKRFVPMRDREGHGRAVIESLDNRLRGIVSEPGMVAETTGRLPDLARALVHVLERHKTRAATARPGYLYVVPLERGGYTGRKHTVIVGLAETTFPGAGIEDPILLDDERERISGGRLPLQRARPGEAVWSLVRLLGMADSHVLLTANRRDLVQGREVHPSPVFAQLSEEFGKSEGMDTHPVYRIVPAPQDALTTVGISLALRDDPSILADVLQGYPALDRGLEAVRARGEAEFGVYHGWLGRAIPALRPGGSGEVLSASRIETLTACPYRYFLRYVLRAEPPDAREVTPGHWLTAAEFGGLMHKILHEFMTELSQRGESPDADKHIDRLLDVMREAVASLEVRLPVREQTGYDTDVRRLKRALQIFLNEESGRRDRRPVGFEVRFGWGASDKADKGGSLDSPEPVALHLSEEVRFRLRGAIDRVDRVWDEAGCDYYEVWDYKSGSARKYNFSDLMAGGRSLQWALYAFALDELLAEQGLPGRTVRGGYFFPNEREHGLRIYNSRPGKDAVAAILKPFFDLAELGAFLRVHKDKGICTFCEYKTVCGSEGKQKEDVSEALESWSDSSEGARPPFAPALNNWLEV